MSGPSRATPRWYGRATGITPRKRLMERVWDALYTGGWPSALARPLGLQGTLRIEEHEFQVPLPDAVAAMPPLRIAFVSDFHAGPGTHRRTISHACAAITSWKPDLVLLGGDYVSFHARHVRVLEPLIRAMRAPLGMFGVLGNHDLIADDEWLVARLEEWGVRVLVNDAVRLAAPWSDVWVCGLDEPDRGGPDAERTFAQSGYDPVRPGDAVRIVLMHSPDGLTTLGDRKFALAFCGHVHGGQYFFRGRSIIGQKGPHSQRWLRGGIARLPNGAQMLVSRGIGQGNLPLRRGADPEVHLCTVQWVRSPVV